MKRERFTIYKFIIVFHREGSSFEQRLALGMVAEKVIAYKVGYAVSAVVLGIGVAYAAMFG